MPIISIATNDGLLDVISMQNFYSNRMIIYNYSPI